MKHKQLIRMTPYFIWVLLMLYTWGEILFTEYFFASRHIMALVLFLLNLVLYFVRFNIGVIVTGIAILLGTFNLLALFPDISSFSFYIKLRASISFPPIDWRSLLLLILYLMINVRFLIGLYMDHKYGKVGRQDT
ncbi:MAG TPA: hypothetical protein VHC96_01735 [Puia sp.]|nr:hypothetical protein [Puia sp.]